MSRFLKFKVELKTHQKSKIEIRKDHQNNKKERAAKLGQPGTEQSSRQHSSPAHPSLSFLFFFPFSSSRRQVKPTCQLLL
jgi:hypothetical protein